MGLEQRMIAKCKPKVKTEKQLPVYYYIDMIKSHESFGIDSVVKVFAKEVGTYFAEVEEIIPLGAILHTDEKIGLIIGIVVDGYVYQRKQ